jgi:hypothetical protein
MNTDIPCLSNADSVLLSGHFGSMFDLTDGVYSHLLIIGIPMSGFRYFFGVRVIGVGQVPSVCSTMSSRNRDVRL